MNSVAFFSLFFIVSLMAGCGGGGRGGSFTPTASPTPDNTSTPAASATPTPVPTSTPEILMSVSRKPDALTHAPYAVFEFNSDEATSFECHYDDNAFELCSSPHTVFPVAVGTHTLTVRARSAAGVLSKNHVTSWEVASIFGQTNFPDRHEDLLPTEVQPSPAEANSWRGIFRINCDFAHSSYNDPIVYPGLEGLAHLHRFYGNTLADHNSDTQSLFTDGESSCQGNALNRSAYWVPALLAPAYDPGTGERLLDSNDEPRWNVVPAVVGNDDEAHEIFYYSAGVDDLESIRPIPLGLKMIAGNAMAQPGMEQSTAIVRWHCQSWESSDALNPRWSTSIPECTAPDRLRMDIFFPSCWNGVDLDSGNHKDHMAYPVNTGGPSGTVCPETHPVPIIRVSFHYAYGVKPEVYEPKTRSSRGWKLASDMYTITTGANAGGISLHGDWFNAWHPEALEAVLSSCIQAGLDCHDGNLARGYRLSGTREGTQVEPDIINGGMGN